MLPSEYCQRQCWITGEADEKVFAAMAKVVGAERLHWGSDYPHLEGHKETVKKLGQCLDALTDEARRLIFGRNACELYNLN